MCVCVCACVCVVSGGVVSMILDAPFQSTLRCSEIMLAISS